MVKNPIHYSVKAAMFFGSHEHLKFLRYEVLSPHQRYAISCAFGKQKKGKHSCSIHIIHTYILHITNIKHLFQWLQNIH